MKTMKKVLSVLLTVSMLFALGTVAFAENGPYADEESMASIALVDIISVQDSEEEEPDTKYIWAKSADELIETVSGVSYDEATNTLTIEDVNMPDYCLYAFDMGNDFKVNVVGDNNLAAVCAMAFEWTSGLEICGDGKLALNAERELEDVPLTVLDNGSDSSIAIGSQVTLSIGIYDYVECPAISIIGTTNKNNAIIINGVADNELHFESEYYEDFGIYAHLAGPADDTLVIAPQTTAPALGDVNCDGKVSIADARLVLKTVAGLTMLTEPQKKAADLNNDGKISIVDARLILRTVADAA